MAFVPGPVTLIDGTSTTAEMQGFDQYGNTFPIPASATVTYSIDTPSIATSTPSGQTDAIAAVGIGVAHLTGTVSDSSIPTPLSDTEPVTVTQAPPVLTSVKLAFGS